MLEFLYLFLYRVLSGAQNAAGYAKKRGLRIACMILLLAFALLLDVWAQWIHHTPAVWTGITLALSALAIVGVIGVEDSFNLYLKLFAKDIHFWETISTGAITLAAITAGGNLLMVIASVYPALLIHKGLINLAGGLSFFAVRTDDITGRTFRIPLLGIGIVRGGNAWRIMLAGFSLVLAAATLLFQWRVTITPFAIDLFGH